MTEHLKYQISSLEVLCQAFTAGVFSCCLLWAFLGFSVLSSWNWTDALLHLLWTTDPDKTYVGPQIVLFMSAIWNYSGLFYLIFIYYSQSYFSVYSKITFICAISFFLQFCLSLSLSLSHTHTCILDCMHIGLLCASSFFVSLSFYSVGFFMTWFPKKQCVFWIHFHNIWWVLYWGRLLWLSDRNQCDTEVHHTMGGVT